MTPNECISIAAATIGDAGFVNLTHEEYISFLNATAHEIWFRAKAAHVVRQYALPVDEKKFTIPDTDIIRFAMIQLRFANAPAGENIANLYDVEETPLYIKEKSPQIDVEEDFGYWLDRGDLQENFHAWIEFHNGQYTIHSNIKFSSGMVLHLYAIIHSPHFTWIVVPESGGAITPVWGQTPTDSEVRAAVAAGDIPASSSNLIWEPFRNVFVEGVLWRAAQQHMRYVKDSSISRIYSDAERRYYRQYLPDAVHFIHSLKDSTSASHIRPFHYLVKARAGRLY